jgi:hypothetical protein
MSWPQTQSSFHELPHFLLFLVKVVGRNGEIMPTHRE